MKSKCFMPGGFLTLVLLLLSGTGYCQFEITDLVSGRYLGTPWADEPLQVNSGTKDAWQFDLVDGSIASDSGVVAGSYWLNDPENWPVTNGQELRNDEMDLHYAVFRFNGGAGVFRRHGQWARYTLVNDEAGYYRLKFRCRQSVETDGFPLIASIETIDSVKHIDSLSINSFTQQTIEVESIGLTSWFATRDSLFIPEGESVLRIDLPSVSDDFNGQGRFGELAFISVDSIIEVIEDTIQDNIYEHLYITEDAPDEPLEFHMYLPATTDTVKAVCFYVDGGVMNGLWWMFQPSYAVHRDYYASQGYAFMVANLKLSTYGSYNYDVINDWLADAVFESLNAFADSTGHPELKYSPVFLYGHSNGSIFSHNFIQSHAERILGVFLSKGAANTLMDSELKQEGLQVPTMFVSGETDVIFSPVYVHDAFARGRSLDAVWSFAIEPNRGHSFATDTSLVFSFFRDVIRQRLPDSVHFGSMPELRKAEIQSGYLGNNDSYTFTRPACYESNNLEASWLPGVESAIAWQGFVSENGTIVDSFACDVGVEQMLESVVEIYPNPSSDVLFIRNASGQPLSMFNSIGIRVQQQVCSSDEYSLQLGDLPTGIYFLKLGEQRHTICVVR